MWSLEQLVQLIQYFSQIFSIPARLISPTQTIIIPNVDSKFDPFYAYETQILADNLEINYYTTKQSFHFGKIKYHASPYTIIIGPVANIPINKTVLSESLKDFSIPYEYRKQFFRYLSANNTYSYTYFLSLLQFLYFCINGKAFSPINFIKPSENDILSFNNLQQRHVEEVYQNKDKNTVHNTYNFEQECLFYVETGNVKQLNQLLKESRGMQVGSIASTSLRQEKNLFIASITMVTRAAIKGGMDLEEAYQLSDSTILEMESLNSIDAIYSLSYQSIITFATRVAEEKLPKGLTSLVNDCIRYIHANINKKIELEEISKAIGYSQSHMSKTFSKEMGISINKYIVSQKIEEAKRLLRFTRKSISEISLFLCFSSQSYFQNTFKCYVGTTPNEYRKKYVK